MEEAADSAKFSIFNGLLIMIVITCTTLYLQFWWSRRHLYKLASKLPPVHNAQIFPFLGCAYEMIGNTENMLIKLQKYCSNGTPVAGWLGHRLVVFVDRPEDIEIVLNSQKALAKLDLYKYAKPFSGNGIFVAPVPIWKIHRRMIMPTFNQKILNQFFEVFAKQSEILLNVLKNDENKFINIINRFNNWSIDSISETAMGIEVNAQTTDSQLAKSLHTVFNIFITRIINVMYHSDFIFNLTKMAKQEKEAIAVINTFVDNVLMQKCKENKERLELWRECPEADITEEKKNVAFLDLLIELNSEHQKLTFEEIKDECKTLLLGGSDTSATTVAFIFVILGIYPDIQKKLYDEIVDVMGVTRPVALSDLSHFSYMERVIKETMRLFPLGPLIFRELQDDLKLEKYTLPKGAGIGVAALFVQRSPEYWKDPLKFDPDRFLPEEIAKRHPYTYIPFSAGPRNCIGIKYAMMSMKTMIATVLRKYHVETTNTYKCIEDIRIKQDMVLKAVNGYFVKLTKRHI